MFFSCNSKRERIAALIRKLAAEQNPGTVFRFPDIPFSEPARGSNRRYHEDDDDDEDRGEDDYRSDDDEQEERPDDEDDDDEDDDRSAGYSNSEDDDFDSEAIYGNQASRTHPRFVIKIFFVGIIARSRSLSLSGVYVPRYKY